MEKLQNFGLSFKTWPHIYYQQKWFIVMVPNVLQSYKTDPLPGELKDQILDPAPLLHRPPHSWAIVMMAAQPQNHKHTHKGYNH